MLHELKNNMAAVPENGGKAAVDAMADTFEKFCIEANRLENRYNIMLSAAEELESGIKSFCFNASKNQKQDVNKLLNHFSSMLGRIENEFLNGDFKENRDKLRKNLDACKGDYVPSKKKDEVAPVPQSIIKAVEDIEVLMREVQNRPRPVFFSVGYYKLHNSDTALFEKSVEEINREAVAFHEKDFMEKFRAAEELGIQYSYKTSLEKKKAVCLELEKAEEYYGGEFDRNGAMNLCKKLTTLVSDSIDRLEINKDSMAYTFGTSLEHGIERYFRALKNNPKEEARYARQSKKRDSLIARGKTVDWKVVPKVVYDPEELKANIVKLIRNLKKNYEQRIENQDEIDFAGWSENLVDLFRRRASEVVYVVTRSMAKDKALELMEEVGIHEPETRYYQYPFEFSGGMRQRIVIAIALAANPDILICDEPTTALDVTIQAQILELINKLKRERNLSVIFITHDLGVVANMADDIAVMYAGKIVEYGTANDIFYDPRHPYTWALLSSMPDLDTNERLDAIPGTPPNMIYPPVGDAFADRNKYAMQIDFEKQPPMFKVSETHMAATWLLHPDAPKVDIPKTITDRIARMKKAGGEHNE
ncbi:MAG: oligopeptide/dipeptide ABC transporter ATP-binding protein [Acetatifactor sp.]